MRKLMHPAWQIDTTSIEARNAACVGALELGTKQEPFNVYVRSLVQDIKHKKEGVPSRQDSILDLVLSVRSTRYLTVFVCYPPTGYQIQMKLIDPRSLNE